jgi:hypothetical protein
MVLNTNAGVMESGEGCLSSRTACRKKMQHVRNGREQKKAYLSAALSLIVTIKNCDSGSSSDILDSLLKYLGCWTCR